MPDVFTVTKRSQVMARIRSRDTNPELLLRKALHSRGFRFRLHVRTLPGKPDLVLRRYRTVIQIRGCFWHGHSCIDGHTPKSRRSYWISKIHGNKRRDIRNDRLLRSKGWQVIVVWACSCESRRRFPRELNRICELLRRRLR